MASSEHEFDFEHDMPPDLDADMRPVDDDTGGHGLVDMADFQALQERTRMLEHNISNKYKPH